MPWTTVALPAAALAVGVGAGFVLRRRQLDQPRAEAIPSRLSRDSLIVAIHGAAESDDVKLDDKRIMIDVLRMIADQHGAVATGLWVAPREGETGLQHVSWSRDPAPAITDTQMGLVRWASENDVLAFDRAQGTPGFVAVRAGEPKAPGALALLFDDKASVTRDALRYWLPRHATRMSTLHEVLRSRSESARRNFRLRHAMRAAIRFQGTRDPLELEEVFAAQALEVSGAEWAVLVRWDPTTERGEVRATTKDGIIPEGKHAVRRDSLLGDVCADAAPVLYGDTRDIIAAATPLIDGVPLPPDTGSLILVPMMRKEHDPVIGALACGHSKPRALSALDATGTRDLATVAAGALSVAWVVEDERATARRDGLTDLFNRRAFEEHFTKAVEWTDRNEGTQLALVIVDIDFFKKVNDTYGHDAGDQVLRAVARVLARDRRATDSVARLGGEELALILPSVTEKGAREVAERLRGNVENLRVNTTAGEVHVTASFGVAVYNSRGGDSAEIFERADKALYAAKHGGRNRVEVAQ
jgi:diguanylate cyclase (GGDEF)-like protein